MLVPMGTNGRPSGSNTLEPATSNSPVDWRGAAGSPGSGVAAVVVVASPPSGAVVVTSVGAGGLASSPSLQATAASTLSAVTAANLTRFARRTFGSASGSPPDRWPGYRRLPTLTPRQGSATGGRRMGAVAGGGRTPAGPGVR